MNLDVQNTFGKIGGTTVSAIVGQNPWETAHSAYLKLRHEVPPTPDNEAMARGRRFEPIVADIFAGCHPEYRVAHNRQGTDEPELYVHPEYDFLIGHPDRLLYAADSNELKAGLEIKTSNWSNIRQWGQEGTDAIPVNYLIQCQWYAGLANLPEWPVAVAFFGDGNDLKSYKEFVVHADRELFETLVESAVDFWQNHVVPGVPPEINEIDETTKRWVVQQFPRNVEPLAVASYDEEQIMREFIDRKAALEAAQKEYEAVETALKLAIGARDGLTSSQYGKVTWRCSKDSSRVDYRGICEVLKPSDELIQKYTKQVAGTRRFLAKLAEVNE